MKDIPYDNLKLREAYREGRRAWAGGKPILEFFDEDVAEATRTRRHARRDDPPCGPGLAKEIQEPVVFVVFSDPEPFVEVGPDLES